MKFSVLMSVYYKEKSENLDNALNSIINQTLTPDEIVIVEDGPLTEELNKILEIYQKKYNNLLKIIKLDKNYGLGIALNQGLEKCSYDLVARMDSDDFSLLDRFEKQINIFEKYPNVSVVGGNICEYDDKLLNKICNRIVPENDEQIKRFLKKRNALNHVSVMYKKSDVISSESYLDCPYFEDYYLWCRMANKGYKFYNIQDILVNVRAGNEMIDRRGGRQYFKSIINFYKKLHNIKFLNILECIYNCLIRICVAIFPSHIRIKFYNKFLRKEEIS